MKPSTSELYKRTTPLWDAEMGARLAIARRKIGHDQRGLGGRLGVSQKVISTLERGHTRMGIFSLAQLQEVLGKYFNYVLFGTGAAVIEAENVTRKFYEAAYAKGVAKRKGTWRKFTSMADLQGK